MRPALALLLLAAPSWAGEHTAPTPAAVPALAKIIPVGPAQQRRLSAGGDLQGTVDALPSGSHLVLATGTHHGPVVLDRMIEISGEPGAVIDGGGVGSVVVITAPDVWLHDVRVTGGGFLSDRDDSGVVIGADRFRVQRVVVDHAYLGVDVRRATGGAIEDCTITGDATRPFGLRGDGIRLWEAEATVVTGNHLSHVRDLVVWYSDGNRIEDNEVRDSRYGTHLMHSSDNVIRANTYLNDVVGVFVMYSGKVTIDGNQITGARGEAGVGLGFKESDDVTVRNNQIVGDTTGLYLDTTPHQRGAVALFEHNLIAANQVGARFHGVSTGARFTANDFTSNRLTASVDGRVSTDLIAFEGNHWSEYAGYDLDGDGFGDLPYEAREITGRLVERHPDLAWFAGTPAEGLIEWLAAAFPMFAPEPILVDQRPMMVAEHP
jgi:nitrous oxidase accessory protein